MRKKLGYVCCVLLAVCIMMSGCSFPTVSVGDIPDPKDTVIYFFDGLCAGDIEKADSCLGGTSLKINGELSPFSAKLMEYLQQSYSYEVVGDSEIDGLNASQSVRFTHLDMNLVSDDLRRASTKIGKNYIVAQNENYTFMDGGVCALTDEGAEAVAAEALDAVMKESGDKYYTTGEFRVELRFKENSWHILLNDELFEAISGKFIQETEETADKQ